jgi:hypothetical protein
MISRSEQFYMLQSFMYAISIHNNQVCEYAKILLQSKTGITYIPLAWTEGGEYFFSRWGYPLKKNNSKCWIPSYTPLSNPPKFPNIVYVYIYIHMVSHSPFKGLVIRIHSPGLYGWISAGVVCSEQNAGAPLGNWFVPARGGVCACVCVYVW